MDLQIIHVLLGKANPNRMNGVNKVVNKLATHQAQLGYKVSVWGITKEVVHNYPQRNYATELFQDQILKFSLSKKLLQRIEMLDKQAVVHLHGGFLPQLYAVAMKLKKHNIPYIYTPHGAYNTVALKRSRFKKILYINLFERAVVKNAKCIHLIGASEVDGLKKHFKSAPYKLIANGQEPYSIVISPSKTNEDKVVFGFVGRIDIHTKGLDILLEGFALMPDHFRRKSELWIIGDGQQRPELSQLAEKLSITENIRFLGGQFGMDKLMLMTQMDFLCLTSRNEGLPGVVLESASLGVPVIVSKETNMGTFVSSYDSGFVLKNNNPMSLAKTFSKSIDLREQNELRNLAKNCKKMISEEFDWTQISKQMIDLYAA